MKKYMIFVERTVKSFAICEIAALDKKAAHAQVEEMLLDGTYPCSEASDEILSERIAHIQEAK